MIEGKIQTRTWDDRESGEKKHRTEIFVYDLTLLGGRLEEQSRNSGYGGGNGRKAATGYGQAETAIGGEYSDEGISNDDIPF